MVKPLNHCLCLLLLLIPPFLYSQDRDTVRIARLVPDSMALAPLIYLASDQLEGRHALGNKINVAADFIIRQLKNAGAKPAPGATSYYQTFSRSFLRTDLIHAGQDIMYNLPNHSVGKPFELRNIVACIPGADSNLRGQYIMLSAHYDHIGRANYPLEVEGKLDSIFNGARDNASGTAAVLAAARYFGKFPPRRSVLLVFFTAEEEGEIGSEYYANHPLVALNKTVIDLNNDNAGYNTTHAICLFGLGRISTDTLIQKACMNYGLAVFAEPAAQHLFERSDNYNFAKLGVPAPCFSMGMIDWDKRIDRYYHQRSDEVDNMDLPYVLKFIRAYILSAQYIANDPDQPRWTPNDMFEKEWFNLYASPVHLSASPQRAVLPSRQHP